MPSGLTPTHPDSGRLPTAIGPYRIEREIGRGAAGIVYAVSHPGRPGTFALKLIRDLEGIDPQGLARFHREAELSARLNHPGVVGALDAGAAGRHRYLVLPFVDGESLADRLRRERALPPLDAAALVARVAHALAAVHEIGVVHRDIKPDNILLDAEQGGAPRIADFGIAREGFGRGSLTQSAAFLGTPAYMAPEQIRAASQVDGKADVYSLAGVLYECICGVPPFKGMTSFEVADQVLSAPPPPLTEHAADVPAALNALCLRGLAKEPGERPDAKEFAAALEAIFAADGAPTRAAEGLGRTRLVFGIGALAVVLGVGVALAAALALTSDPAPQANAEPTPAQSEQGPGPAIDLAALEPKTWTAEPLSPHLVADLRRALAGDQQDQARLVLGDYLLRRSHLSQAVEVLEPLASSQSTPRALRRRGSLLRALALRRLGRAAESTELEYQLVFEDPDDAVGLLVRTRKLFGWQRGAEARPLIEKLLRAGPQDRLAIRLATFPGILSPERRGELLDSPRTESDPYLLLSRARLLRNHGDSAGATAAEERALALCAERGFGPLLRRRLLDLIAEGAFEKEEAKAAQALALAERIYASEPMALNAVLLLSVGGGGTPEQRAKLYERLRAEARVTLTQERERGLGEDLSPLADYELAEPDSPADECWAWARARVETLRSEAREPGFAALLAAIEGKLPWSFVRAKLDASIASGAEGAALLAAEICLRRGRTGDANRYLQTIENARRTARLRARVALYQGHDAEAFAAWQEIAGASPEGRLAEVEIALAQGDRRLAAQRLALLDESHDLDVLFARIHFGMTGSDYEDGEREGRGRDWRGRDRRGRRGRDSHDRDHDHDEEPGLDGPPPTKAEQQALADLEQAQRISGSLDFRLRVDRALLTPTTFQTREYRIMLKGESPEDLGPHPLSLFRYYAGSVDTPASYFFRAGLLKLSSESQGEVRVKLSGGRILISPVARALAGADPSPILAIYFALLERPSQTKRILAAARARDPKARLPEHLLGLVKIKYGEALLEDFAPHR